MALKSPFGADHRGEQQGVDDRFRSAAGITAPVPGERPGQTGHFRRREAGHLRCSPDLPHPFVDLGPRGQEVGEAGIDGGEDVPHAVPPEHDLGFALGDVGHEQVPRGQALATDALESLVAGGGSIGTPSSSKNRV
ncbi:hypothetical protein [Amycolatopsis sp. NPDC051061]|uniref:hypothetical protein n=1 Tax=Amycolatopsis sp. NPDC051061 TaxID=3155042 RepID=UPI00342C2807